MNRIDKQFTYTRGDYSQEVDEYIANLIEEVVSGMPKEAQEYIHEKVTFYGPMTNGGFCKKQLQLLEEESGDEFQDFDDSVMLDTSFPHLTEEYQRYVIAHEIAHILLKHDNPEVDLELAENEADEFAQDCNCPKPEI